MAAPDLTYKLIGTRGTGEQIYEWVPTVKVTRQDIPEVQEAGKSELFLNNLFSSDTVWIKAGSTISGGVANVISLDGSYSGLEQTVNLVAGKNYIIQMDVTELTVNGGFAVGIIGVTPNVLTGNAIGKFSSLYQETITGPRTVQVKRGNSGVPSNFKVTRVSFKEIAL